MNRVIVTIILLCIIPAVYGQNTSAEETVKSYSVAQKRLLAKSTFQFANFVSQNNLDQDSIMAIACRITGVPFLLMYNEGFADKTSDGEDLINSGKIAEAKQLLINAAGENRLQLLIELAIWYLHQPGFQKADLDSASSYIDAALRQTIKGKYSTWEKECRFLLAELSYQRGNYSDVKNAYSNLVSSVSKEGNNEIIARAYHQLAILLPTRDSMKLVYCKKSLEIYHQLQLREKEIEILVYLAICEENLHMNRMENNLLQVLSLMQLTNFKHVLYAQNLLAFAALNQAKYKDALVYANAALKNMKWSRLDAVVGTFYYRLGGVYEAFGKYDKAIFWFRKALDAGKNETHLFWYKSLFFAHALFIHMNRPAESLSMIKAVMLKAPPITLWEKMQVFSCKGQCYEKLYKPQLADQNYMSLLDLANNNRLADPEGELSYSYLDIANFYISQKDLEKAKLFLKQGLINLHDEPYENSNKYSLLFKIDTLRRNFRSALQIHMLYRLYYDSLTAISQKKKIDELTVKYAAEKRDQDIKLLKQQGIIQHSEIKRNRIAKDILIGGTILLLTIVGLLFSQYKLKQRTSASMNTKNIALQQMVVEKEWLLKEVHHRVKNNLHTIISLLESQAAYLENDALRAIENSQHRIYAMSLIHQKMYQTEDVKTIDMSMYLPEFIRYLDQSFDAHHHVVFQLEIEPVKLDVSQAIPVAMIINEAVTNSIKYAFPKGRKGIIKIIMRKVAGKIMLTIGDNGIGINESLLSMASASLGLKLMKGLSADINATINFKNNNGTTISIIFDVDPFSVNNNVSHVINEKEIYM